MIYVKSFVSIVVAILLKYFSAVFVLSLPYAAEGTKEREKTSGNKLTNAVLKVFAIASATLKTVV